MVEAIGVISYHLRISSAGNVGSSVIAIGRSPIHDLSMTDKFITMRRVSKSSLCWKADVVSYIAENEAGVDIDNIILRRDEAKCDD